MYPWLVASQMVPIVAVAPILVVWFGFTIVPKVVVVALVCFFPVVVNTTDGLKSVDPEMVRLMRTLGIAGVVRGKPRRTTIPDPAAARAPDLVNRQFTATRPNQLWVSDFTYVASWSGTVYVAFVIDVFSRLIVGWRAAASMRTELVLDALEMAIWRRAGILDGLVCHSDAGSQYTSLRYTTRLAEIGAAPSIGAVGDSYDNSLAESTIGLFKTELIRRHDPWRTLEEVELATLGYIDWFNHHRLHGEIGDIPPAELEATYYRQPEATTAA